MSRHGSRKRHHNDMRRASRLEVLARDVSVLLGALERGATAAIDTAADIRISIVRLKTDIDAAMAEIRARRSRKHQSVYDVDGKIVDD